MAKNDLKKIDNQLEEAKKRVALLEQERKEAEENLQKQIGKIYVQIQLKKNKNQSYESIFEELKMELNLIKEDEKETHHGCRGNRERQVQAASETEERKQGHHNTDNHKSGGGRL